MKNLKNELVYQWRMLKSQVKGGYQETKKLLNYQDLKEKFNEGLRIMKEDREYEKQQTTWRKFELLKTNDVVTFRDPDCPGNILTCKVLWSEYEWVEGRVLVDLEVLDTCLNKKIKRTTVYQDYIFNNLLEEVKHEQ